MKKRTIIAIIVAASLIITGGIILVLGLSIAGDDTREYMLSAQEISIPEHFDSILIDAEDCNVVFVPFNGTADPYIVLQEKTKTQHSVQVMDGVLKIQMQDKRNFTDYIGVFGTSWESMEITLYLPQKQYEAMNITTDTGDIQIPTGISAKQTQLCSDTGDIRCDGMYGDLLMCTTDTGDIYIRQCEPVALNLQSKTGAMDLRNVESTEIHLTTTTGDKTLENVVCKRLICESGTGDVALELVMAEENLQIITTTGDVEIESSDAGKVNIETNKGDVEGHFLTAKWFQAYSDTGNVRVPHTRDGGECRIESNTGDIHFE